MAFLFAVYMRGGHASRKGLIGAPCHYRAYLLLFKGGSLLLLSLSRLNTRPRRCDEPLKSCSTDLQKAGTQAGLFGKMNFLLIGFLFHFALLLGCLRLLVSRLSDKARNLNWLAGFIFAVSSVFVPLTSAFLAAILPPLLFLEPL
uniref:hypothetical protein n=1 Tax=Candidatus Electronema sp. TaxID=2698783 RepID=UPI004055DDDD